MTTDIKETPPMPAEYDTQNCVNCIHYGNDVKNISDVVCSSARSYMGAMVDFKEKFTYVDWESVFTSPAISCKEFIPKFKVHDEEFGV